MFLIITQGDGDFMKKLLIAVLSFASFAAMAGSYNCNVQISRNGDKVGRIQIEKTFGTIAGRLYTVKISDKKNIFGKKVEEVEVALDGLIQSGDGAADSSIEGQISVIKHSYRGRNITKLSVQLAKVKGVGAVQIFGKGGDGFTVEGGCDYL